MGSPLGPVLADIFMASLERRMSSVIDQTKLYRRYVDDIFCIVDTEEQAIKLLEIYNGMHNNIKVTIEHEQNGRIPFLDVHIERRPDGTISRSVYRKHTWSGQYLHFSSFVPIKRKQNLVRTLHERARKICSEDRLETELTRLMEIFKANGYPDKFVRRNSQQKSEKTPVTTVGHCPIFIRLPFKGDNVSRLLENRLTSSLQRVYHAARPEVIYSTSRLPTPRIKLQSPLFHRSNVLYQFTCSCRATYVGRTERQLKQRVSEHVPVWVRQLLPSHHQSQSIPFTGQIRPQLTQLNI